MNEDILNFLLENRDEKYRKFHASLCPGADEEYIIGVRIPVLRAYAKKLKSEGVSETGMKYYEEIVLKGMLIGLEKFSDFEKMRTETEAFLPYITNWAICDTFCAGLKQTKKYRREMLDFLKRFLTDSNEYKVRFAVVMLLDYYLDDEYADNTLELLKEVKHEGYYAKMAVAWALSAALVKHYEKTLDFMQKNGFDDFIHNKALQKARESYRLIPEKKAELAAQKR